MSSEKREEKPPDKLKSRKKRMTGFEQWGGYMASKKMKLAIQFDGQRDIELDEQDEIKSDIFKGVSIFVNGYTKPSADALKRLMLIHGGNYHHYYSTTKTTHIIASNLPYSKVKNLKNQIVVTPDWITDSIKTGTLLPYQSYFLYPPEVLNKQQRLKLSDFTDSKSTVNSAYNDKNIYDNKSCTVASHNFERDNIFRDEGSKELQKNIILQSMNTNNSPSTAGSIHTDERFRDEASKELPKNIILQHTFSNNSSSSTAGHTKNTFRYESSKELPKNITLHHTTTNNSSSSTAGSFNTKNTFRDEASKELPKNITLQHTTTNKSSSSTAGSIHPKNSVTKAFSPSKTEAPVTAGHPDFLSEFYSRSRLHHISTAGQELKRYVQSLVDSHNSKAFVGRENLKSRVKNGTLPHAQKDLISGQTGCHKKNQQVIMHLDMDCFFVSVGLRNHPELRGKPVAVTHSKGKRGGAQDGSDIQFEASYYTNESKKKLEGVASAKNNLSDDELLSDIPKDKPKISKYSKDYGSLSEIASCSYEARKAGIRNGMFLGEALRRCPNLKTIPYDFEGYSEVSKQLYDIVASYTLDIEAVSCDELYIDCTELIKDTKVTPLQFASVLREEIEQNTGCTASAGIGPNMLLARLANKVAKPNGQYYVTNEKIQDFIARQKVKDLPGVGYSTSRKFEHVGVITCGDLQNWSLSKLQQEFGPKTGQTLYNRCRGKDNRVVQLQKERKSVSAEINYGIRFEKEEEVFKFLKELSVEVVNRLRNINCKGKSITLKLMIRHPEAPVQTAKFMGHGVCDHIAKSVALKSATDNPNIIGQECCSIARSLKIKPEDYRGIGIQLSKLEPVQKDTKGYKSIESFICAGTSKNETESHGNKEIFAPKDLAVVNKPLPKGSSVKDFLSDKSSPKRPHSNQNTSLTLDEEIFAPKDLSVVNKPLPKGSSVKDFLSDKSSPKKQQSNQHTSVTLEEEIFASKDLAVVNKPLPKGSSVKDFLSDKSSPKKQQSNQHTSVTLDEEIFAPKDLAVINKPLPKGSSVKDFLSDKSSPKKQQSNHHQSVTLEELDQSVLNALPEDLQREVLAMYSNQTSSKPSSSAQHSSTSTRTNVSTSKSNKASSKKGINLHPTKSSKTPTKHNTLLNCLTSTKSNSSDDTEESVLRKKASIGGAENINEVRSLVKEWVLSSQVVLEEDIDQFRDYILQVIDEDLKKVDLILKYFHRVVRTANTLWQQAYLTILSYVQQKMLHKYGTMLEAKSDFTT